MTTAQLIAHWLKGRGWEVVDLEDSCDENMRKAMKTNTYLAEMMSRNCRIRRGPLHADIFSYGERPLSITTYLQIPPATTCTQHQELDTADPDFFDQLERALADTSQLKAFTRWLWQQTEPLAEHDIGYSGHLEQHQIRLQRSWHSGLDSQTFTTQLVDTSPADPDCYAKLEQALTELRSK